MQKTTIFDPNIDSKQESLEFITSTGVNNLYFILEQNPKIILPTGSIQYKAYFSLDSELGTPKYPAFKTSTNNILNSASLDSFEQKSKEMLYYGNLYETALIYTGSNYRFFELKENTKNKIFTENMQLFNRFFLERIKEQKVPTQPQLNIDLQNDYGFNIPPKYVNRTVITGSLILNTDVL